MIRETANALVACVVTFVLCAVAYPAAVWGLGQLAFPHQAEGSLVLAHDRTVIGSELIAQPFASDKYFFSRPSAVDYKADATGGSNLGTKNPDLRKKVIERAKALKATEKNPVPVDMVTASGGGMDPHISPEAARYQAARVAAARSMPLAQVEALISKHVEHAGAIIGAPARVNVLELNLDLDDQKAEPSPANPKAASSPPKPTLDEELHETRAQLGTLAGEIEQLGKKVDIASRVDPADVQFRTDVKAIAARLTSLQELTHALPEIRDRVGGIEGRVGAVDQSIRKLQTDIQMTRDALRSSNRRVVRSSLSD
jgi:potassium-transporting ATPase KdpC subunit